MDKVESADSIDLGESHQSTEQLDKNDKKKNRTIRDKFTSFVSPFLLSSHEPLPQNPTHFQRLKYSLLLPPHSVVGELLTRAVMLLLVWGVAYSVLGDLATPTQAEVVMRTRGGAGFSTLVLLLAAMLGGQLASLLSLPPLLGMLITGMLLANLPVLKTVGRLDPTWSSVLRSTALVVILIRAGLGLDPDKLRKLSLMVFRLAFLPCLAESCIIAVASYFILGLPWLWGFMLGFVLSAVSPAVVVPCLLSLQSRGLGVAKGIPTLVIAAASIDDVLAISCFTILVGVIFNPSNDLARTVLQGPIEVIVGLVYGVLYGLLAVYLPAQPPNSGQRLVVLVGGGLLALFGLPHLDLPGAGPLAVLVMAFVVGLGWRRQGWGDDNPVTSALATAWTLLQPLLFSLIGAEVDTDKLDTNVLGLAVVVIMLGLVIRLMVSQLAVLGGDLSLKERIFVALAWLPKATVQAAIGPIALDKAKQLLASAYPELDCSTVSDSDMVIFNTTMTRGEELTIRPETVCAWLEYGNILLTVAVAVIIITAPIGAVAILVSGPRLLLAEERKTDNNVE